MSIERRDTPASPNILLERDGLKMVRVYAIANAAEVIDCQSMGNLPFEYPIGISMCLVFFPKGAEHCIPLSALRKSRNPAPAGNDLDARHETLEGFLFSFYCFNHFKHLSRNDPCELGDVGPCFLGEVGACFVKRDSPVAVQVGSPLQGF